MLHELMRIWFQWVDQWGYFGVFLLMAMESSIIPVPSEVVIPPAAYWAAQGRLELWGVILAGTLGSYVGSAISYGVARSVGLPFVNRYGKFFLMPPKKLAIAETWITRFGFFGIFVARLLPVIRHLISIPAGIFKMNFIRFSIVTLFGAGLWCTILAWFGKEVIGSNPLLLQTPDAMVHMIKDKLQWFVGAVIILSVLYYAAMSVKSKSVATESPS